MTGLLKTVTKEKKSGISGSHHVAHNRGRRSKGLIKRSRRKLRKEIKSFNTGGLWLTAILRKNILFKTELIKAGMAKNSYSPGNWKQTFPFSV